MMRIWQAVILGIVGMLCTSTAQAGPIWSLDWQFGTGAVISNTGRSDIVFEPHNTSSSTPSATAVVATLVEKSSVPAAHPDPITNQNYGAFLKLTDLASHASRYLWFSGTLSGNFSKTTSSLTNRFVTPTSYSGIHLGKELYSVAIALTLPSASNHFQGSLTLRVTDPPFFPNSGGGPVGGVHGTPEPASWAMASVGLALLGFGAWRRRQRPVQ